VVFCFFRCFFVLLFFSVHHTTAGPLGASAGSGGASALGGLGGGRCFFPVHWSRWRAGREG
jgi:hypothetical protein